MKSMKKILLFLLMISSLTFSSINITPVSENLITVEAASIKPTRITKISRIKSTTTSLKIKIKKIENVSGYQVRTYKDNHLIKKVNTSKTYVTIKSLNPGTTYKIKVRAYLKDGKKILYGNDKTISYTTKHADSETGSTTGKVDTPAQNQTNSSDTNVEYVYLSKTGTKYHRIPNCGTMNPSTARKITKQEAINSGYSPCSKCF